MLLPMSPSTAHPFTTSTPARYPSAAFGDDDPPRLSAAGSWVWLVAWWVALVALVVVAVSPWLVWEEGTRGWALLDHTGLRLHGQALQVVFVGPTVLVAALALWLRGPVVSAWAAVLALVGCVGVALTLSDSGAAWPGWGAGLAVFGYPLALVALVVLGWLSRQPRQPGDGESARWGHGWTRNAGNRSRVHWRGSWPGRRGRVWVVAGAAAVVAGGGACVGAYWYAVARVTDHTTAAAVARAVVGGPAGRVLWRATSASVFSMPARTSDGTAVSNYSRPAVPLASGLVAASSGDVSGLATRLVVRSATGAERWHYARPGAFLVEAVAASGGRVLVAVYQVRDTDTGYNDTTALGFNARTGAIRWQRWFGEIDQVAGSWTNSNLLRALYVTPAAIMVNEPNGMLGISTTTGRTEWSARLPGCDLAGGAIRGAWGAGRVTVLDISNQDPTANCPHRVLLAFGPTGTRWTNDDRALGRPPLVFDTISNVDAVTTRNVIVEWVFDSKSKNYPVLRKLAVLDTATGRVRFSFDQPATNPMFMAANDRFLLTKRSGGGLVVRDALTGARVGRWNHDQAEVATIAGNRAYLLERSGIEVRGLPSGRLIAFYPVKAPSAPASIDVVDGALVAGYTPHRSRIGQNALGTVVAIKSPGA